MLLGDKLHSCELICPHAARADVVYLPTFDEVVECLHSLFYGDGLVKAMDLEEVDVRGVKALEGCIDGSEDTLSR